MTPHGTTISIPRPRYGKQVRQLAAGMLSGLFLMGVAQAAESWSDERLPVKDGLEFWYDCSRQNEARTALELRPLGQAARVDYLLDSSGTGRHLAQPFPAGRPQLVQSNGTTYLSFDGQDDSLVAASLRRDIPAATLFLVAGPRSNGGGFRSFLGLSRSGENDYTTGLNLDLGPDRTAHFARLNVEGSGAPGATQLLRGDPTGFGWHIFSLETRPGQGGVRFWLDGRPGGTRERRNSTIALDEIVLGARRFSNSAEPAYVQGFLHGGIAEVLCYSRVLEAAERTAVEAYLKQKHANLLKQASEPVIEISEPSVIEIPGEPPPRSRTQVEAILAAAKAQTGQPPGPFEVVLCAGPKDHGLGEHDYPLWQTRWLALLRTNQNLKVSSAWEWPSAAQWQTANTVVFYSNNPGWNSQRAIQLDTYLGRGGGLVFIHWAVDGHQEVEALAQRIGLAWRGGHSKFRHGPLDLKFNPAPLTAGFTSEKFVDESYWNLIGDEQNVQVLATQLEEGRMRPMVWTRTQGPGRIFVSIPGHYTWTFDDPLFRILLLRGICWSGGQPMDRLSHLAFTGVRIAD